MGFIFVFVYCNICFAWNGYQSKSVFQEQFIKAVRIVLKMQVIEICNIYLKLAFINMQLKIADMWDMMLYN